MPLLISFKGVSSICSLSFHSTEMFERFLFELHKSGKYTVLS